MRMNNIWSAFYLWRCLSVSAPNICLSWSASLCLCPEVLLMTSQKRCDKTNKNLESLRKRARPRGLVTDCQWGSSGRKTRAMWPLMRRPVGFETKLIYLKIWTYRWEKCHPDTDDESEIKVGVVIVSLGQGMIYHPRKIFKSQNNIV